MRIDSHQHFWHYNPAEHVWMNDRMDVLKTDYLPDDLKPLLAETGINGTIAVQARQNLHETAWLLELSNQYDVIKGVVGWVNLRSHEVSKQLEQYATHYKLIGVRHVIHDEPDDAFILGEAFLRGLSQLRAFNLVYDLLLFPKHLPYAIQVVEQFPEQRFVLDHIAKPLIRNGTLEPWASDICELAKHENVYCKVSGMVTEAVWGGWTQADFVPYLDVIFDCFGAERLMFGSDWPVCTLSATYGEVVGIVTDYIQQLSDAEQARVMGTNAIHVYNLE